MNGFNCCQSGFKMFLCHFWWICGRFYLCWLILKVWCITEVLPWWICPSAQCSACMTRAERSKSKVYITHKHTYNTNTESQNHTQSTLVDTNTEEQVKDPAEMQGEYLEVAGQCLTRELSNQMAPKVAEAVLDLEDRFMDENIHNQKYRNQGNVWKGKENVHRWPEVSCLSTWRGHS